MKILTVDIGTGTQDIYLYDSRLDLENGFKLVIPSPTMMVHQQLQTATQMREPVLLTGVIMGGGPSQWAAESHLEAGLEVFATPSAARSFNDDLDEVREIGIRVISEDEAEKLAGRVRHIELLDFDYQRIFKVFESFGVILSDLAAVAVAVFDHGNSPPGYSDRQFRFDYLDNRIRQENKLSAFAFQADHVPEIMTRLQAVVASANGLDARLVVMDTAPAAVLGASYDPTVSRRQQVIIANVGNFHTLAFRMGGEGIEGVFEHHTGFLDSAKLDSLLVSLANGSLRHEDVFDDHGHGALIYSPEPVSLSSSDFGVAVTGPRRSLMRDSSLRPYYAAPFGDMMITGCFGLLAAAGDVYPELDEEINNSLKGVGGSGTPPWELNYVT